MSTLFLNRKEAKTWTRAQKSQYKENAMRQNASAKDFKVLADNAGLSPDDAYREVDSMTMDVMNPVGEFATMFRLNAVAKSVSIGTTDYTYRQRSQMAGGTVSMSGQTGVILDKVDYKHAHTVIPIMDFGAKRDWRAMLKASNDGLDVMADDAEEAELVILRTANDYMFNGDASVKSDDGAVWLGIKGDPTLVQTTTAVDLASSSTEAQTIVDTIGAKIDLLRITNNCSGMLDLGVSREIMSHWDRTPFSVGDKAFGSLKDYIAGMNGIKSLYEEPEFSGGKEFMLAFIDPRGLHAVTGQAVSTYMKQRFEHNDPFVLIKWLAQGYCAKADYSGQKTALYCKAGA